MHSVGNDIVDLQLAEKESNWQRKGFLEKQFTEQEQSFILNSENPFLSVWIFWTMKEAAYKCYTQKHPKQFFAPSKFDCNLLNNDRGSVSFKNNKYFTTTDINTFYIHTIAETNFVKNAKEVYLFSSIGNSKNIDLDLKKKLQEETGFAQENIEKRKTEVGAPLFYNNEKKITNSCSISHHGNYGAFAFTLNDRD
jgi:phosphopantetheinyl transferase (holo-ACP synthase)